MCSVYMWAGITGLVHESIRALAPVPAVVALEALDNGLPCNARAICGLCGVGAQIGVASPIRLLSVV